MVRTSDQVLALLLTAKESSALEYTTDTTSPRELAKEIVALANLRGGTILLGVDDDRNPIGLTRADAEEWVMAICRDKIRPEIIPYYETVALEDGISIAAIDIEPGYTAHALWHNQHRTYYIRVGTTTREASLEELERLLQRRAGLRAELRPVGGSTMEDLDGRRLADYFGALRGQPLPQEPDGWRSLLRNTELLAPDSGHDATTLAGLLLFGNDPQRFLPFSTIVVSQFGSAERSTQVQTEILRVPLVSLRSQVGKIVDAGMIEQSLSAVRRRTGVDVAIHEGARTERPTYPEDVVREVVVNAVVHRDYLLSAGEIELAIFPDRLEVSSPGRLPNGITPAGMRDGVRAARNQMLKDVMRDYGYLEHLGLGISRTVIPGMKRHNGTEPVLEEAEERFTVTLHGG